METSSLGHSPLGQASTYPAHYDPALLFPIARSQGRLAIGIDGAPPFFGADLWNAYEVSWLDPRGKPQVAIARFTIGCETPNLIESKSLKLYLTSFRNHGAFHEACTVGIARRLEAELSPAWLRIGGYWYPRGGIPIDVFYQSGEPPAGVWIPPQEVQPYRGRG